MTMRRPVFVDQSRWGLVGATGADGERFLQGMLTNDVASLAPGGFVRAAVLNVKGRVLAVVDLVADGDAYLLITEPVTAEKLQQILERHAIADDVELARVERACHRVWDSPEAVWTAPPIFAPPPEASSDAEVEICRVEGGLPRYGVDVSEDYFPFEANLDTAVSMTKGCYIGQEVVARAHARGHANKRLCGVVLDGPVAAGAPVAAAAREAAGTVTSAVVSPDFGPIALAYIHKSAWDPGTKVRAGDREGTVVSLPFKPR